MELKHYTMESVNEVARSASREIELFLMQDPKTINVRNVEDDPSYRSIDIDLIWRIQSFDKIIDYLVEIKADRNYSTGNYFFETISNESRNTPGCFIYSKADLLFYYFIDVKELHIIPMEPAREWFLNNLTTFKERRTSTDVNGSYYVTVGRLVPRAELLKNVEGIVIKKLI